MKLIPWLSLALIALFTLGLLAQPISSTDSNQNMEIARSQDLALSNSRRIEALEGKLADLQGSYNRGIGIGAGVGLTLALMQIFQIAALAFRRTNDGPRLKERY